MAENEDILVGMVLDGQRGAHNAQRWADRLNDVIVYMRTDHVGMVRGDGDLTRYMAFLMRMVKQEVTYTVKSLDGANLPPDLPF